MIWVKKLLKLLLPHFVSLLAEKAFSFNRKSTSIDVKIENATGEVGVDGRTNIQVTAAINITIDPKHPESQRIKEAIRSGSSKDINSASETILKSLIANL